MNGAESLVETLASAGVEVCFANPGTSEMNFVAALDRVGDMRCVLGLFEGVVTGAADGYARMANRPASTLLHLGPGLANGLANVHNARRANTPMVNIVGDHATYHKEYDAPLTSDVEGAAQPFSDWVRTSADSRSVARDGAAAVAAAMAPPGRVATLILPADASWNEADGPAPLPPVEGRAPVAPEAISDVARVLRSGEPAVLFLGGHALREVGLMLAGRIGAKSGARLLAQTLNARVERGAGRVAIDFLPYPVDEAIATLDEALSAARAFMLRTRGAAAHDYLQVTGGAIGIGVPLATGAAIACPDRKVICLQADGSAMYTVQALWTQAREGLDVTTLLLNNRSYAILKQELANFGAGDAGRRALDMMELDRPALDWVGLARGMGVEAGRAKTMEELERQLAAGLSSEGPYLIDLVL